MNDIVHAAQRRWQADYKAELSAVGQVRRAVRARLLRYGLEEDSDALGELMVMASELVTNAIVHACAVGDVATVRLWTCGGIWQLEVQDPLCRPLPEPTEAGAAATGGRGLLLVRGLSDEFGVELLRGRGKNVWVRKVAAPAMEGR
ncbi:ATP-binding protein [Kitasatospora sp. NPDC048545]|uniref:ATP-binding protein n=1 Tax=Kitasatospora sp. NPDC048545 TaxID=3157208 RepID=UPI0033D9B539